MLNHGKYGFSSSDKAIIRIFDVEDYIKNQFTEDTSPILNCSLNQFLGKTWKISKGDVIVNGAVLDEITSNTPITVLSDKYGKDNIFKVNSINVLIFNDSEMKELNHVKLGCI